MPDRWSGTLSIAILALEQVALMGILCAADHERHLSVTGALRFAGVRAWPVLRVAARIVVLTLLALSRSWRQPACVYWALLTEFDINYYLQRGPRRSGSRWVAGP